MLFRSQSLFIREIYAFYYNIIRRVITEINLLIFSEPYTRYKIWIRAFTDKHEGVPSEEMVVWTDVQPPGQPEIVSLTCQSGNTMFVRWVRPDTFYRTVDVYSVHYRALSSLGSLGPEPQWEQQLVETDRKSTRLNSSHSQQSRMPSSA